MTIVLSHTAGTAPVHSARMVPLARLEIFPRQRGGQVGPAIKALRRFVLSLDQAPRHNRVVAHWRQSAVPVIDVDRPALALRLFDHPGVAATRIEYNRRPRFAVEFHCVLWVQRSSRALSP